MPRSSKWSLSLRSPPSNPFIHLFLSPLGAVLFNQILILPHRCVRYRRPGKHINTSSILVLGASSYDVVFRRLECDVFVMIFQSLKIPWFEWHCVFVCVRAIIIHFASLFRSNFYKSSISFVPHDSLYFRRRLLLLLLHPL